VTDAIQPPRTSRSTAGISASRAVVRASAESGRGGAVAVDAVAGAGVAVRAVAVRSRGPAASSAEGLAGLGARGCGRGSGVGAVRAATGIRVEAPPGISDGRSGRATVGESAGAGEGGSGVDRGVGYVASGSLSSTA